LNVGAFLPVVALTFALDANGAGRNVAAGEIPAVESLMWLAGVMTFCAKSDWTNASVIANISCRENDAPPAGGQAHLVGANFEHDGRP